MSIGDACVSMHGHLRTMLNACCFALNHGTHFVESGTKTPHDPSNPGHCLLDESLWGRESVREPRPSVLEGHRRLAIAITSELAFPLYPHRPHIANAAIACNRDLLSHYYVVE